MQQTLAEFYQIYDIKHTNNIIIIADPSYTRYHPIIRQSVEFKQFLGWYRQY